MPDAIFNPSIDLIQSSLCSVKCEAFGIFHNFQIDNGSTWVQSYFKTFAQPVAFIWIIDAYSQSSIVSIWLHRNSSVTVAANTNSPVKTIQLRFDPNGTKFSVYAQRDQNTGIEKLDIRISALLFYSND